MATYCPNPNCKRKLKITDWKQTCPACGVNILYYKMEERLDEEADRVELASAASQKKFDRAKAAVTGSALAKLRFSLLFAPLAAILAVLAVHAVQISKLPDVPKPIPGYASLYEAVNYEGASKDPVKFVWGYNQGTDHYLFEARREQDGYYANIRDAGFVPIVGGQADSLDFAGITREWRVVAPPQHGVPVPGYAALYQVLDAEGAVKKYVWGYDTQTGRYRYEAAALDGAYYVRMRDKGVYFPIIGGETDRFDSTGGIWDGPDGKFDKTADNRAVALQNDGKLYFAATKKGLFSKTEKPVLKKGEQKWEYVAELKDLALSPDTCALVPGYAALYEVVNPDGAPKEPRRYVWGYDSQTKQYMFDVTALNGAFCVPLRDRGVFLPVVGGAREDTFDKANMLWYGPDRALGSDDDEKAVLREDGKIEYAAMKKSLFSDKRKPILVKEEGRKVQKWESLGELKDLTLYGGERNLVPGYAALYEVVAPDMAARYVWGYDSQTNQYIYDAVVQPLNGKYYVKLLGSSVYIAIQGGQPDTFDTADMIWAGEDGLLFVPDKKTGKIDDEIAVLEDDGTVRYAALNKKGERVWNVIFEIAEQPLNTFDTYMERFPPKLMGYAKDAMKFKQPAVLLLPTLIGAVLALLAWLLGLALAAMSCGPKGFERNLLITIVGLVGSAMLAVGLPVFFRALPDTRQGFPYAIAYGLLVSYLLVLGINLYIKRKGGVPVAYKECFIDGIPEAEVLAFLAQGGTVKELRAQKAAQRAKEE